VRVRSLAALASWLAGAATVFAAFPATDVFLPMVGRSPGVPPSQWYTTVWVFNPNPSAVDVRFHLLERNKTNTSPVTFDDVLQPGETRKYENAVQTLFGRTAWGAIRVTSAAKVVVNERFYDHPAGAGDKETTGQSFAGVPRELAIGAGQTTQLLGAYQTLPAADSDFRYNFGFVETTGSSARLRVTVLDQLGGELAAREYTIGAYSQLQYAFRDHFPDVESENARLRVQVVSGVGRVIAYGTGIANGSQDPTTFEMASVLPSLSGVVEHDATLTGDGTAGSPLGLADAAVTLEKIAAAAAPAVPPAAAMEAAAAATRVLATDGSTLSWQEAASLGGLAPGGVTFGSPGGALAQDAAGLFWNDATNALGIGTTTPTQQLELTGNLQLPATTDSGGQLLLGTGRFLHGAGSDNTFVGLDSGRTSLPDAAHNVGVGDETLASLTDGDDNTAVGSAAMVFDTTGSANTAVGSMALLKNTSGFSNTAVGYVALSDNTTGPYNTAVGFMALDANTTGGSNTAVGYRALATNTGAHNSALGFNALSHNTAGGYNSAFGEDALLANTTGAQNVAIGLDAMEEMTAGSYNTALGTDALSSLFSGDFNVALGFNAGYGITGGDNNIYIGAPAGAAEESNTIRIGDEQTAAYLAGASGATSAGGVPLLVGADGKLGTASSSRRAKEEITDVAEEAEVLMRLRPVAFYYRPERDPERVRQYGLIAEEVAEVAPGLVVRSPEGEPEAVRYHLVNALLLAEVQRQRRLLDEQAALIGALAARVDALESTPPRAAARR